MVVHHVFHPEIAVHHAFLVLHPLCHHGKIGVYHLCVNRIDRVDAAAQYVSTLWICKLVVQT